MRHLAYRPAWHPLIQAVIAVILVAPWILGQLWSAPIAQAVSTGDGLKLQIFTSATSPTPPDRPTSASVSHPQCLAETNVDTIDFDWSVGAPVVTPSGGSPTSGTCPTNDFLVYAHGYVKVPGTYTGRDATNVTFYNDSSDGFYMQLVDPLAPSTDLIFDSWNRGDPAPPVGASSHSGNASLSLQKGMTYELKAWAFDHEGAAMMKLYWDAETTIEIIPKKYLFTTRPLTPQPVGADLLTVHASPSTLTYNPGGLAYTPDHVAISTLSTTGSVNVTGALTYNKVSGNCTVNPTSGQVTATDSGLCIVTVTKAGDSYFATSTSAELTIPILHVQAALTITGNSTMRYAETQNLGTTGGSIAEGVVTYTVKSGPCTVSGRTLSTNVTLDVNPVNNVCKISAVMAADTTYEAVPTITDFSVTVSKQFQDAVAGDALTISANPSSLTFNPISRPTSALTAAQGKGSGPVTFTVTSGPCTVPNTPGTSNTATATSKGTCSITATKATDLNYLSYTTVTPAQIIVAPAVQSAVTVVAGNSALTYRASSPVTTGLTASGGSGSGNFSFEVDADHTSVCQISNVAQVVSPRSATATLTIKSSGQCDITARRAADTEYSEQVSTPLNITAATPVSVSVNYPTVSLNYGVYQAPFIPILATGGINTKYYAPSKPSTVGYLPAGLTLNATTGEISGTPTAASATTNYTITAQDSNDISAFGTFAMTVAKAPAPMTWDAQPSEVVSYVDSVPNLAARATGTTSIVQYSIDNDSSAVCSVISSTGALTIKRAGICNYRASVLTDSNYNSNAITGSFSIQPLAPSAPQNISGSVSDQDLTISWNAPADDGGSAIAGYTALATSGGLTSSCVSTGSSCTINNLNYGTTYTVVVTSRNSAVGSVAGQSSQGSPAKSFTIPSSSIKFATGQIGDRYDPDPVTQALAALPNATQQKLLDSGIVKAPAKAPSVTITANLSQTSYTIPVLLSIPQTIDSGTEVHLWVLPPTDTPVGTYVQLSIQIPNGDVIDLGTTSLTAAMISAGADIQPFAIVPTGSYIIAVSLADKTSGARAYAVGADRQSINYKVKVVSGAAGVPTIGTAPTPTAAPEPSITPTITPSPEPTVTESITPSAEPSPEASVDARGLVVVDPLAQPAAVAATAVTAVTLVSAVSAAASAAAAVGGAASAAGGASGAAGGASGGARSGGGTGGSGGSGSSGGSGGSGGSSGGPDDGSDNLATVQTVDVNHESFEDLTLNWGDALPLWQSAPLLTALDQKSHDATVRISRFSPLIAKLITDGAYTTALAGVISLLLPVSAVVLAIIGIFLNGDLLLPPAVPIFIAMTLIGVFDAGAGFIGMVVFGLGMGLAAGVHTASDVRMLAGLMVIGFGPSLLAGAFRGLRRPAAANSRAFWERAVDLGVAPFIAGWAMQGMISALSSLAGVELPIAAYAGRIGLAVGACVAIRVVLEEFTAQFFPGRLNRIHPTDTPPPSNMQKSIALAMRAGIFYFVAGAFIGFNTYLAVGTFLFILPNYIGLFQDRFPNFPKLYQFLPAGLPGLAWSLLTASWTLALIGRVLGDTPVFAQMSFALLPISSGVFAVLAMIGREPLPGDTRWYQRDRLKWLYRIGGIAMLIYTMNLAGVL